VATYLQIYFGFILTKTLFFTTKFTRYTLSRGIRIPYPRNLNNIIRAFQEHQPKTFFLYSDKEKVMMHNILKRNDSHWLMILNLNKFSFVTVPQWRDNCVSLWKY
jgi:hypothetical protein